MGIAITNGAAVAHAEDAETSSSSSTSPTPSDANQDTADTSAPGTSSVSPESADKDAVDESESSEEESSSEDEDAFDADDDVEQPAADRGTNDDAEPATDVDSAPRGDETDLTDEADEVGEKQAQAAHALDADVEEVDTAIRDEVSSDTAVDSIAEAVDAGAEIQEAESTPAGLHASAAALVTTSDVSSAVAPVTVKSIITDVMTWVGLGPLAADLPVPALPVPSFVEALWVAVRQTFYSFNNQRPVATTTISGQDPLTGVITGKIDTVDYEGDPITYIVTTNAAHGTVVVDDDGSFTYTPDPAYALTGGTDKFVVTVEDRIGSPHTYGLLGALGIIGPTTTTLSLLVLPILPLNRPPKAGNPAFGYTVNPTTGQVVGTVDVLDEDGDELEYVLNSALDPAKGTLVVDRTTGNWTYTPTQTARETAYTTPGTDTLPFTITVTDGQASITVNVSAPITELAPTPIKQHPEPGTPPYDYDTDPATGTVTGTVNVTDPDGDTLTYTGSTIDPAKGTLVVDRTTGNWTYTPTQTARETAYTTPGTDTLPFTITVTDGQASITVNVSAPITELAPATSTPTVGINLSQSTNSIIEGNSGTTYAPVIVELSAPSDKEITVNYRYQTSYASGGSSETTTGTLTFAPGQTRATIAIPVEGDTIYEGTDYLRIVITDATNAVVVIDGAEPGRYNYMDLRILNDDVEETPNPSVTVGFPRNSTTVVEGNNGP
ncbi:Ig-like domain-containing protein, partial [Mycolicibacterium murale]|uniref:Ig-like domain-containing protein n=1 Tax=Mycolicibacterium murale TaxID=182220 RepID=UPI0031D9D44F